MRDCNLLAYHPPDIVQVWSKYSLSIVELGKILAAKLEHALGRLLAFWHLQGPEVSSGVQAEHRHDGETDRR